MVKDTLVQTTFLTGNTYYTLSSVVSDSAQLFLTRVGANDPNFNLRRDPSVIIRKRGKDQLFVNVLDIHGSYDPVSELSEGSAPAIKWVKVLQHDENYTVIVLDIGKDEKLYVCQSNNNISKSATHSIKDGANEMKWTGPFLIRHQRHQTITIIQ